MKEIFVSKNGRFPSVEAARDEIRRLRAAGETGRLTVRVEKGEYGVKTLAFAAEDSGVTYCADGEVTLSGGLTLPASLFGPVPAEMKERLRGGAREKVVCADLKKLGLTRADWGEMCAIGSYHTAARYDGSVTSSGSVVKFSAVCGAACPLSTPLPHDCSKTSAERMSRKQVAEIFFPVLKFFISSFSCFMYIL